MEILSNKNVTQRSKKRKSCENERSIFPLNELNEDILERVLSFLPTCSFYRSTSVCKKWKSVTKSPTFVQACSNVSSRDHCFFMVDSHQTNLTNTNQPIIFDSLEKNWKKLNPLPLIKQQSDDSCNNFLPVASSGGLICFRNPNGTFVFSNPITGSTRKVEPKQVLEETIQAIAMSSSHGTFKLIILSGELSNLKFKKYNINANAWEQENQVTQITGNGAYSESGTETDYENEDFTQYFLTKCGNVVSTNTQRSPCKQFSSLLTVKNNDEILYFLSSHGTVVSCNLTQNMFFEYPRLLPLCFEYSIDIVELESEMYVVLLSEFLESASVRIWKWDETEESWCHVAMMPPWMSDEFYGKNVDVNCSGAGKEMMVCLSSDEICGYFLYNLVENEWVELPKCDVAREFVCGLSFEPRIEASIGR